MKVTYEMVFAALNGAGFSTHYERRALMRSALEAALEEVPEPDAIVKACDMACRGLETRIAELESAVQHADKVVEQLTAERDAALERAEKADKAIAAACRWGSRHGRGELLDIFVDHGCVDRP